MTIGKTELLQYAAPGSWQIITDYPGTNTPDGCGANSDYSVTYSVEATPPLVVVPRVAVPNVIGMPIAQALIALRAVGLVGIEKVTLSDVKAPSNVVAQTPEAGSLAPVPSEVQFSVKAPPVVTHKPI